MLGVYDIGGKENEFKLPENADDLGPRLAEHRDQRCTSRTPSTSSSCRCRPSIPQETPPGGKPPTPQLDTTQPVISVVMIRSLGDVRFPGFMTFVVSGILFVILCNTLHRRDKLIARNRAAATT